MREKGKKEEGKAGTSATIAMVETNKANKAPVLLAKGKEKEKEKGKGNVKTIKERKKRKRIFLSK